MAGTNETPVSGSFVKLQRIAASFDDLRAGTRLSATRQRTLRRMARELGPTVVPSLMRRLGDRSEPVAEWALRLTEAVIEEPAHRPRVSIALGRVLESTGQSDAGRMRALDLLAQIGGPAPVRLGADDMSALRDRSLRELARCLGSRAEVARAADLFRSQLDDDDLVEFLEEFAESQPECAAALVDELLARGDVGERGRGELRRLRAPLPEVGALTAPEPSDVRVAMGPHADGRSLVVAWVRRDDSRPARHRVLAIEIATDGALTRADYRPEVSGGTVERRVLRKLRAQGFALTDARAVEAAGRVGRAARLARAAGRSLPGDFFLGRDILGLVTEHMGASAETGRHLGALLGRAVDLVAVGDYGAARPLLERYITHRPDDAEGRANLGLCLLVAGELSAAERQLRRAAALAPDDALPHWNLASVAHRAGRRGGCYLALVDYLERSDRRAGADERREAAESFTAEYERLARLEHDRVAPARLAHADELCTEARAHLARGAFDDAIGDFERALHMAPSLHSAWSDLGLAYAETERVSDAVRCLRRALKLCPADEETRARLAAFDESGC